MRPITIALPVLTVFALVAVSRCHPGREAVMRAKGFLWVVAVATQLVVTVRECRRGTP